MKRRLSSCRYFVFYTALLTAIAGHSAPTIAAAATDSAAQVRAVMAAQVTAWNRGDVDGFMAGYARSAATEFVSGDKVTRGWETVRDRYRRKYDNRGKMGELSFSDIEITPIGADAAIVLGRWKLIRHSDKPHGFFTLLFRRTSAGWRIVHDHTSTAGPP
jgi:ketosteroid isomerase-like protein